jgi:hypothetical protein
MNPRMRSYFYHAVVSIAVFAAACGGASNGSRATPASAPATPAVGGAATPAATPAPAGTTTSDAIARGRQIIEQVRAAAGGGAVTAMRAFEATGTSNMSVLREPRTLHVRALFPSYYRQAEVPPAGKKGLRTLIGMQTEDVGWILGAALAGDGRSSDRDIAQLAYTRAARQTMAGWLAGVNAPWLVDSGKYTPVAGGTVDAGDDRHMLIVSLEGPDGRAGRLLVDPNTHLPRRFIEPPQPGTGGEAARNEINFSYADYRNVDGVQLPMSITRTVGRIRTLWSIEKYTVNPKLSPRDFTRTAK